MNKDREYKKPNTRTVPVLITLAAAGIQCVICITGGVSFGSFVWKLLITVIIFGILGSLIRLFLDMGFNLDKKENEKKALAAKQAIADAMAQSQDGETAEALSGDDTKEQE